MDLLTAWLQVDRLRFSMEKEEMIDVELLDGATSEKPAVVALNWPSGPITVQKSIVPALWWSSMQFKIQSLDRFCCANSWSWKRTWPGWPRLCALTFLESVKMERCCWISADLDPDGLICSSNAAPADTGHARQGPVSPRLSRSLHVCPKMDSPILYIADSLQVPCWCTIGSMEGLAGVQLGVWKALLMIGGKADGSKACNSSTCHSGDGRSATQTPSQDLWSDGPTGNTGCVSCQKRTYEESARNNEI